MDAAHYEQVGKLIYGTKRFEGKLARVTDWMAGGATCSPYAVAEVKFARRAEVAAAFFASRQGDAILSEQFMDILRIMRKLEQLFLTQLLPEDEIENHLAQLRKVEAALPDLAAQLGYS